MPDATLPVKVSNIKGQRFGRLVALEYAGIGSKRNAMWKCVCDCGSVVTVCGGSLRSENTRSCGCLHLEVVTTHGMSGGGRTTRTPEYQAWMGVCMRCHNPNGPDWDKYGGRGIKVCERWLDFAAFLADMGQRPTPKHSIDRIDNDGNYCPENCRWATRKMQDRNKSSNHVLTFKGETLCLTEWAERIGLSPRTLTSRLALGWTIEEALTTPKLTAQMRRWHRQDKKVTP